jgi:dolichol-phosphate mannosyltransferase
MYRRAAILLAPLLDVLVFCTSIGLGASLRTGNAFAFAAGLGVAAVWRWRAMTAAGGPSPDWRFYPRVGVVALMGVFLRGGALALLQRWGWPPQAAILPVAVLGLAVTLPGLSYACSTAPGATSTRDSTVAGDQPWRLAVGLIAYAFALRAIYAGCVELMPEETYYWSYSQHLDFGYLDHPPMVAWLIRAGTTLFGQTEFGVRAGALCCGIITSIFIYKLARNLFGEASALAALLLAQALPYFFLSGFLMTPDAPLAAAWAASLYFLERALIGNQSRAWWFAGLSLGIGMISKYTIAILAPVTLAFMAWDPQSRHWWRRKEPYLAALLALALFSPVLVWNAQHGWASFVFQTSRRVAETPQFALHKLLGSIVVLLTPTGLLAAAGVLWTWPAGGEPAANAERQRRLFMLAIVLPLSVFAAFSLRHEVKLDWTGPLWTAALPAMGFVMIAAGARIGRLSTWARAAWMPTAITMLLIYGAGLHYLVLGLPGLGYGKHIEVVPVGWRDLSAHIVETANAYRETSGAPVLIVGMDRYAIASELAFYGGAHTPSGLETANSHLFGGMALMYGQWMPPQMQEHRNLLLVAWSAGELQDKSIEAHVARLGPIEDDVLMRDGIFIRHYYHRLAFDYRSAAAEK